jgi:Uma2 family endonuclease
MGATSGTRRWTWDDLLALDGQEGMRYEIIGGELFVNPSGPSWRHQQVVLRLAARMLAWAEASGGDVVPGPNVYFTHTDVVLPDVVCVGPERLGQIDGLRFMGAPDLVVEVSSPSTRRYDLIRKRRLFESHGVPEYWFVDLDSDRVEVFRLARGQYGDPVTYGRGDVITPPGLRGLKVDVADVLGPA